METKLLNQSVQPIQQDGDEMAAVILRAYKDQYRVCLTLNPTCIDYEGYITKLSHQAICLGQRWIARESIRCIEFI
ncbi:hypothetical protein M0R79_04945 [Ignavigranum ruoffiae]|uniref:hypothetical protein n=1 Tax=Ignavigranum ruoffiae TaxID=89093 RepID=UPI002050C025|nr:hypothetical protein [Ignavigranum ruoffiae]UPQ85029.1 hypothetical protein M0R79_04945 [Ignavigranum ruoffiae]